MKRAVSSRGGSLRSHPGFHSRHLQCRLNHNAPVDSRNRLSAFWTPTGGIASSSEDSNDLLVKAGYLRQAYSGVFHMLPLGLRVQEKLQCLIEKHMRSVAASKLAMSTLSSQALWEKSGRLKKDSEIFRLRDRKNTGYVLSPTHEEEITSLAKNLVTSYRDLPLRLYQITRKYRDELRPRQGLLRGREFVMKDLYTFDYNQKLALETYTSVKEAYVRLFDELKLPYMVATADSGNMGGSLSHEFHMASSKGEDRLLRCTDCNHAWNEEVWVGEVPEGPVRPTCSHCGKPTIETLTTIELGHTFYLGTRYSGILDATVAVDEGVMDGSSPTGKTKVVPFEMGCHGIGVSRMITAVADILSDARGLNWPRVIAPFEAVIIADKGLDQPALSIYEAIRSPSSPSAKGSDPHFPDVVIDDRRDKSLIWKMRDADLIGYPIIVVLGKAWKKEGKVEVQCRRLNGLVDTIPPDAVPGCVSSILAKL